MIMSRCKEGRGSFKALLRLCYVLRLCRSVKALLQGRVQVMMSRCKEGRESDYV